MGSEAKPGSDRVGETVGDRFDLLAFAAAGGMGHVYRARDRASGEQVAIKLLAPDNADRERFMREAEVLASIEHPGVVRYLAHGTVEGGAQYLAMEWLAGEDLADKLTEGVLDVADALGVAQHAAAALAAAHERGVVHRDLKPGNLFLVDGRFDAIKLLDFGIARTRGAEGDITVTGAVVGTPAYMAPEQVRGGAIDARADVYSLGAVIFRCLAGRAPFGGVHPIAVLAKVLLEPAPPIREIRPDVPPAVEALLARMLAKEPELRPADCVALGEELRALGNEGAVSLGRVGAAITAREQRVACVVLCAGTSATEVTVDEVSASSAEDLVRRAVEQRGGTIDTLAKGAWIVTVPQAASPAEQATLAARCALALSALRPGAPIFVATGRVLVSGEHRVGEVIDRATDALLAARHAGEPGGARIDEATGALLEGRFKVTGEGSWRMLEGEEDTVAPVRTLLRKPSPCVGREQPLALLAATLAACESEPRASAVLVTGPPGLGKTRLVNELARTTLASRGDVEALMTSGDPMRAGSPFGVLGQLLRRAIGVLDSDPGPLRAQKLAAFVARDYSGGDARRMAEMLGEICSVLTPHGQASPSLRAARADVSIMADAMREAWVEWLGARTARGTVILLVEDLHWADAASVRLIEEAIVALPDRPLLFLATARPEGSAALSTRLRERGLVEVALAPLSARAAEKLVREALGPAGDDALVATLVRRAGGHPFHLEELVRAVASGRGAEALPDSVLGMVQARLDALGAKSRRILRAASVFGDSFWAGGVAALLGDDLPVHELSTILARLVEHEVLTKEHASKWRGEVEYRFRHALLREGAYAMLAEADRVRAHRRAATWLESRGESDPAVLADHYDRGAAAEQALTWLRKAATHALQRNDFDRAITHASRARALGPDEAAEGALRAIEAEVAYWRGDFAGAAQHAAEAAARLGKTAPERFDAVSIAIGALGQLGRNDEVATWLDEAARASSPPESRGAHVVALARGMTQLLWAHHGGRLPEVHAAIDALGGDTDTGDAFGAGWVRRVRGESAWLHDRDVGRCLSELGASCAAFDRARAVRALCLTRMNAASLTGWSGEIEPALALLAQARAEAERLGAGFLLRYARAIQGLVRAYGGDADAEGVMRAALVDLQGSPRLAFICRIVIGFSALDRGDVDAADAEARAAQAIKVVDDLRPAGIALASRVALARGDVDEAVRLATAAEELESSRSDLELTYGVAAAALGDALLARGDRDAARAVIGSIASKLDAIARTIEDPGHRARFWRRRLPNDRVARLAEELGVAPRAPAA